MLSPIQLAKYYTYVVEWDSEDNAFIARTAEWESLIAHGTSPTNALLELIGVVADCIEDCRERGEEYPQPFNTPIFQMMN